MSKTFDIRSGSSYPSNYLSNFAAHTFVFDSVRCASMEGLLQSLKFRNWPDQAEMCMRRGMDAKMAGKKMSGNWQKSGNLWWRGEPLPRAGQAYQQFLDKAYQALYDQSSEFRKALALTDGMTLTHDIGINNPKIALLTIDEFCQRLTLLRSGQRLVLEELKEEVSHGL